MSSKRRNASTTASLTLKRGRKSPKDSQQISCTVCDFAAISVEDLLQHVYQAHADVFMNAKHSEKSSNDPTSTWAFRCPLCPISLYFDTSESLLAHVECGHGSEEEFYKVALDKINIDLILVRISKRKIIKCSAVHPYEMEKGINDILTSKDEKKIPALPSTCPKCHLCLNIDFHDLMRHLESHGELFRDYWAASAFKARREKRNKWNEKVAKAMKVKWSQEKFQDRSMSTHTNESSNLEMCSSSPEPKQLSQDGKEACTRIDKALIPPRQRVGTHVIRPNSDRTTEISNTRDISLPQFASPRRGFTSLRNNASFESRQLPSIPSTSQPPTPNLQLHKLWMPSPGSYDPTRIWSSPMPNKNIDLNDKVSLPSTSTPFSLSTPIFSISPLVVPNQELSPSDTDMPAESTTPALRKDSAGRFVLCSGTSSYSSSNVDSPNGVNSPLRIPLAPQFLTTAMLPKPAEDGNGIAQRDSAVNKAFVTAAMNYRKQLRKENSSHEITNTASETTITEKENGAEESLSKNTSISTAPESLCTIQLLPVEKGLTVKRLRCEQEMLSSPALAAALCSSRSPSPRKPAKSVVEPGDEKSMMEIKAEPDLSDTEMDPMALMTFPVNPSDSTEKAFPYRSLTPTDSVMQSIANVIEAAKQPTVVTRASKALKLAGSAIQQKDHLYTKTTRRRWPGEADLEKILENVKNRSNSTLTPYVPMKFPVHVVAREKMITEQTTAMRMKVREVRANSTSGTENSEEGEAHPTDKSLKPQPRWSWNCTECGVLTKEKSDMLMHIQAHREQLAFRCPHTPCMKSFKLPAGLEQHIVKEHRGCTSSVKRLRKVFADGYIRKQSSNTPMPDNSTPFAISPRYTRSANQHQNVVNVQHEP